MTCIKTGFHGYVAEYGEYVYGDAYQSGAMHYFRICERSQKPLNRKLHFTITQIADWFDKDAEGQNSTLIASITYNHGYEGETI